MSKFKSNLEFLVQELGPDVPSLLIDLARVEWDSDEDLQGFVAAVKGVA